MSGQEPTRRATAGSRESKPALVPIILIPSPADLAAGRRTITADEEDIPRSVRLMRERALAAGWSAQVTYSHVFDTPPYTGAWAGRWVPKHIMCLRVWRLDWKIRAYAIWSCIDDGSGVGSWKAEGGQAMIIGGHWATSGFGVTEFGRLLDGQRRVEWVRKPATPEQRKKIRGLEEVAGYELAGVG